MGSSVVLFRIGGLGERRINSWLNMFDFIIMNHEELKILYIMRANCRHFDFFFFLIKERLVHIVTKNMLFNKSYCSIIK